MRSSTAQGYARPMNKIIAMLSGLLLAASAAAVTVTWSPPTQNTDGSQLTNLAGYRVVYGQNPTNMNQSAVLMDPEATSWTNDALPEGRYYFAVRALNTQGVESDNSTTVIADIIPAPPNPPSLVATAGRTVFYLIQQTDRLVFLPVGTLRTDVSCDSSQPVGPHYVVPRAAVSWYGSVRPRVVVATCN